MIEIIRGIITAITGLIVFSLVIVVGFIYNLFYPIYMAFKTKSILTFFKIWWRLIDGTLATIGEILYQIGEKWDMLGNVWGEWIEDLSTSEEKTQFGEKLITISAAVGELEHAKRPMSKSVKVLSRILNIVFGEKWHALGSWLLKLERDKLKERNLKGK